MVKEFLLYIPLSISLKYPKYVNYFSRATNMEEREGLRVIFLIFLAPYHIVAVSTIFIAYQSSSNRITSKYN